LHGGAFSICSSSLPPHAYNPPCNQIEELKQQVRILQAVTGYGTLDDTHAASSGAGEPGTAAGGGGHGASSGGGGSLGAAGSLEGMLLGKNRRLEHELTMARLAAAEGEQRLEAAQAQVGGWGHGGLRVGCAWAWAAVAACDLD